MLPNPENCPVITRLNNQFAEEERQEEAYSKSFADDPNALLQETLAGRGHCTISLFKSSVHVCYDVWVDDKAEEQILSKKMQQMHAWRSGYGFYNRHGELMDPSDAFHKGYDRYTKTWRIEHCKTVITVTIFAPNE